MTPKISVIIPVYNEQKSLPALWVSLQQIMNKNQLSYEVIFADDGSQDGSPEYLTTLASQNQSVRVIFFRRNFGQTAAIAAAVSAAQGEIIIPMDADGQNDPADIPRLIQKLEEGYDVVSGWRKHRQDVFLTRRLPSTIANILISWVTGVTLHDYGCTLKAYRREIIKDIPLYGEMHRFLPAYAVWRGAKIAECEVQHHPRAAGRSHYGLGRTVNVILDLLTTKFLTDYLSKPSYIFGRLGGLTLLVGFFCGAVVLYEKYILNVFAHKNPLLLLAMFLGVVGIQFFVLGLLAEILIRTYYGSRRQAPYVIAKTLNLPPERRSSTV